MTVLATAGGVLLIAIALRDVFDTLFHPAGRGVLGRRLVWLVAAASGARREGRRGPLVGPVALMLVLATWTALIALGWALVLWPHLPEGFIYAQGLRPDEHDGLGDAVYLSLVNLTSLGYGDISPEATALRLISPLETVLGLALVTASISWLISIYGVLARRRSLAHEAQLALAAQEALGEPLPRAEPDLCERLLANLTTQLVASRRDFLHFPISHWFRSEEPEESIAVALPLLRELAREASGPDCPRPLRVRAHMLERAIADYERAVAERWR